MSLTPAAAAADPPTRLYARAVLALLAILVCAKTVHFAGAHSNAVDFDCFMTAGRLALSGHAADAYRYDSLARAYRAAYGAGSGFLPFSYPPIAFLVLAPMAALPAALAYALVMGASLGAYLGLLRRVAGAGFTTALMAATPVLVVNIVCGQNGLLTGALGAAAALALAQGRPSAGLSLGLLALKPHLAIALAVQGVLGRRWGALAIAHAIVVAAVALTFLTFGPGVWIAFGDGLGEASAFLRGRYYPLFRMVSVYAFLLSLGAPEAAALAAQAVTALAALAGLVRLSREGCPRRLAGVSMLAGVFISPYVYDYDMALFVMGLAMLLPDLQRWASRWEQGSIYGLVAFAALYGTAVSRAYDIHAAPPSLAGPALAGAAVLIWRSLARARAADRSLSAGLADDPPLYRGPGSTGRPAQRSGARRGSQIAAAPFRSGVK